MHAASLALLEKRGYTRLPNGELVHHSRAAEFPAARQHETKPKPAAKPKQRSPLAARFEEMWKALGGQELTPEHRFHQQRKWRLDYVHLPTMIAIELEGGIFCQGRHSRPRGMQNDCDKYNNAATLGYSVYRLTTGQITRERLQQIIDTINSRLK